MASENLAPLFDVLVGDAVLVRPYRAETRQPFMRQ